MSKAVIDIALIEISLDIKIAKGIVDIRVSDMLHQGIFSVLFQVTLKYVKQNYSIFPLNLLSNIVLVNRDLATFLNH